MASARADAAKPEAETHGKELCLEACLNSQRVSHRCSRSHRRPAAQPHNQQPHQRRQQAPTALLGSQDMRATAEGSKMGELAAAVGHSEDPSEEEEAHLMEEEAAMVVTQACP